MEKESFSRRNFLKTGLSAAFFIGCATALRGSQVSKEYTPQYLTEVLQYDVLPSPHTTPIVKGGIGYNAVFLPYRDNIMQEETLDFAVKNGATFLRVFFDCPEADYEPEIGAYQEEVLQQFSMMGISIFILQDPLLH